MCEGRRGRGGGGCRTKTQNKLLLQDDHGIIFESEETTVFECNRISCKGYCNLVAVNDLDFRQ